MTSPLGRRASLVATTVLLTSPLLAACGGSSGAVQTWAGTYCGSASSVRQILSAGNDALRGQLEIPDNPPGNVRSSLSGTAGNAATSARSAVQRVTDAGEPEVAEGEQIQEAAVGTMEQLVEDMTALEARARAIPLDDPDAFTAEVKAVSEAFAAQSRDLAGSLKALDEFEGYDEVREAIGSGDDVTDVQGTCERLETVRSS
ncbi:hypothetical protein [Nocardioides aurantiacus]|nr:hypothetical protein [Nocardioides aurantiacus]